MAEQAKQDAADVQASEEAVDKSTTTDDTASKETKETKSTETKKTLQEEVDDEIAKDLAKDNESEEGDEDVADDTDETEETKDDAEEEKTDEDNESEEEQEVKRAKGAEARKEALQTEIRELVARRNELRKENDQLIDSKYRTETAEELVEQGLTEAEAENEVLKQQMQMAEFKQKVNDLNATLNIESLQVMQDFPVFDPDSNQFNEKLRDNVAKLYQQASQPKIDEKTGLVTESNLMPYDFYKAFAETDAAAREQSAAEIEQSRAEGKVEGQKAADKELAEAETPTATPPAKKSSKEDPFMAGLLGKE